MVGGQIKLLQPGLPDAPRQPGLWRLMSEARELGECARQLLSALPAAAEQAPGWLWLFASPDYDLVQLVELLQQALPETDILACTTAGELTPQGYREGSVTGVAFARSHFTISTALVEDMPQFDWQRAEHLAASLIEQVQSRAKAPVVGHSFALAWLDGLCEHGELLVSRLNTAFGATPVLGGSAGDDLHFTHTQVIYRGRAYTDAAVVALVNTSLPFAIFSQRHVQESDEMLVVTEADSAHRRVLELDAEPAAEVYARMLGVSPAELCPTLFACNTLSVRIGEEGFVRAIQQANADGSLTFYCAVERGIVLRRNHYADMLECLHNLLAELDQRLGAPQLLLAFDCIFRRLELEANGRKTEAEVLLQAHQAVGFSTYGEHIEGVHLNHTLTGVVIGQAGGGHDG
ncbi:nitric oxide-sensing protein NosP [Balneatrix alpica]|uniref:Nitric oxide-sensing protein NosP n=1 Tax=Balneatrix alpica TaxID=75684 RepID=A0ABV5ZC26_9GAMM|nr:nitric oxide-sensing protein NosP [Balneatrix alpica]